LVFFLGGKKMKRKEREEMKMKQQLGISNVKSIEERGRQIRPVVFDDKRAKARKNACDKQVVKKIIQDF